MQDSTFISGCVYVNIKQQKYQIFHFLFFFFYLLFCADGEDVCTGSVKISSATELRIDVMDVEYDIQRICANGKLLYYYILFRYIIWKNSVTVYVIVLLYTYM